MKRSSQVALLLMGVTGVGAAGYTMTRPPPDCVPPGAAASVIKPGAKDAEPCPPRRSWSSSSTGYNSRSSWTRTNSSSYGSSGGGFWPIFTRTGTSTTSSTSVPLTSRSSSTTTTSRSSTTTRSGFGSTSTSVSRSSSS